MLGAMLEADLSEQLQSSPTPVGVPDAGAEQRHFDVRARRQRLEQKMTLEDEPDELATLLGAATVLPNRLAVDQDLAALGHVEPADQREQRALARA